MRAFRGSAAQPTAPGESHTRPKVLFSVLLNHVREASLTPLCLAPVAQAVAH